MDKDQVKGKVEKAKGYVKEKTARSRTIRTSKPRVPAIGPLGKSVKV